MVTWTLFATIYQGLITPLLVQLQGMIGQTVATVRPVALALVALWLCFAFIEVATDHKTVPAALREFMIAAFFVGLLQSDAVYNQYVGNLFLQTIPNSIAPAFGGQQNPAAGLDAVLNSAMSAALKTYQALPWSLGAVPLGIGIVIFLIVALASVGFAFGIYAVAVIMTVVAVFVGPVFVGLAAAPLTRRFAFGWLSVLVGSLVTQLMALAVLLLLTTAEGTTLRNTAATITTGDNSINMLLGLGQCGLLMALCTIVIKQIPAIAYAIGSGVYQNASAINRGTFGVAATAGAAAIGASRGAAGAIGRNAAAQMRPTAPTGPSLSRGVP